MKSETRRGGRPVVHHTGSRFGLLVAVERMPSPKGTHARWRCRCDCGGEHVATSGNLRSGAVRSCGCLAQVRTHGHASKLRPSRAYKSWSDMKDRCINPRNHAWNDYGGRGITVCDRWCDSFENFLADMGEPPDGHSIDRIENDDGYRPGNCQWSTPKEQANNRRSPLHART